MSGPSRLGAVWPGVELRYLLSCPPCGRLEAVPPTMIAATACQPGHRWQVLAVPLRTTPAHDTDLGKDTDNDD